MSKNNLYISPLFPFTLTHLLYFLKILLRRDYIYVKAMFDVVTILFPSLIITPLPPLPPSVSLFFFRASITTVPGLITVLERETTSIFCSLWPRWLYGSSLALVGLFSLSCFTRQSYMLWLLSILCHKSLKHSLNLWIRCWEHSILPTYCRMGVSDICIFLDCTVNRFILLLVGVLVFIPVVGLASFHVVLVCKGRTTNEHVSLCPNSGWEATYM